MAAATSRLLSFIPVNQSLDYSPGVLCVNLAYFQPTKSGPDHSMTFLHCPAVYASSRGKPL
jgi:hypothetical protein